MKLIPPICFAVLATLAAPTYAQPSKTAITVNTVQIFGTIDPAKINDYTEYMAAVNLYDGLTTVDKTGAIAPQLAESWDISDDNLTYTFHLKKNAVFQDGSPITARDVVYSVNRLIAINEGPSHLFTDLITEGSVTAIDDHTVEIRLNKVFAPFLAITPLILVINQDKVQTTAQDPWGESHLSEFSEGAGPYRIANWQRGAQMSLARFTDYHAGWPQTRPIDEINFVVTRGEATVRALAQRGQLGMSSHYQSPETYKAIEKMDGYELLHVETATGFYIKLNNQAAPTDDVHVRRAIAMAMDYATVREVIFPGGSLSGPLSNVFKDAVPNDATAPALDLDAAKAELAKSRYAGKGPIKITHTYVSSSTFEEEIALLFKATLDMVGFEVEIRPETWNRISELASTVETTPHSTQVFFGPTYPSPDSIFYMQYHSKATGTWASMDWVQDPAVDALIDASRNEIDLDARNAIYQQTFKKLVEDQRSIWLLAQQRTYAINSCLKGYTWVPMQSWAFDYSRYEWAC